MRHTFLTQNAHAGCAGLSALLATALDSAPFGLTVLDATRKVRLITDNAASLLGCSVETGVCGLSVTDFLAGCRTLTPEGLLAFSAVLCGDADPASNRLLAATGPLGKRTLSVEIRQAGAVGWVLSLEDVTSKQQTQDWLLEHASSDPVTGLWNRQHFLLMLQDQLGTSTGEDGTDAVLLLALQKLKHINDTFGPASGDTLLRLIADRLFTLTDREDMLARLSGDEFALAVHRRGGRAQLAIFASQLAASLAKPFLVDGQSVTLNAHIGIACAPWDGETADALVANASLALQETTTRGAAAIRFFEPALTERARERRALEADLRLALDKGEFELQYQPQVDVHRGCVTGLEALIRWRSPQRGLVPPDGFVSLAEQIGLIDDIGTWVLREACRQAISWPEEVTVAVNASPLQFETGHFARCVAEALADTGLDAARLEIEITESLLLRDTGVVMGTLAALHAMGVRLVLDDFGTGYASLSQLSRFRFDKIKIDRSFISPIDSSLENSAIVRSIAALGVSLGIPTTAEGVETARQLEQIKADGCTCVQGYFFSRPVPSADVQNLLVRLHHSPVFAAA